MFTLLVVIVFCTLVIFFKDSLNSKYYKNTKWKKRKETSKSEYDLSDYGDQLKIVSSTNVQFSVRQLMNKDEFKLFYFLEKEIMPNFLGCRIFSQASLGEIVTTKDNRARSCFNSKRVDILIINRFGYPILIVEYQGGGHYQGNATQRDAVKKEVCRKAGIQYIEVTDKDSNEHIKYIVSHVLQKAIADSSAPSKRALKAV